MSGNGTMMQYFEWYLPSGMLWKQLEKEAPELASAGITGVWIPPCYKGNSGAEDVGYAVYDLYDLGEFDQKGSVPTRYGTLKELLAAIRACHGSGLQVYADIVLDHRMGGDEAEEAMAKEYKPGNREEQLGERSRKIEAYTHFMFPGRNKKYSDFEWHWNHFVAVDHDAKRDDNGVFKFRGKEWQENVDRENGNYDYLMGADVDLNNPEVIEELTRWGKWFLEKTDVDGFRLDAVKHMEFTFYHDWLDALRRKEREELFTVGEYWSPDLDALKHYLDTTVGALSLFDVPLHYNFLKASNEGNKFDMRTIFDNTLTKDNPAKSVTFVDNHDSQPGQSLESWVQGWFRQLAYALLLLRQEGYPCVFYGDWYGISHDEIPDMRPGLLPLLEARRRCAYGRQNDYFDHANTIGWTREGDDWHENSGLACVMTNGGEGSKRMYVGEKFRGATFRDITGNREETVVIDDDGSAEFRCNGGSVSVWVRQ